MKLHVLSRYRDSARGLDLQPGQEVEVDDELGEYLLRDSPGSFSTHKPAARKASSKPAADKAVKEPADQPARRTGTRKK